jgi:hypothetical protein
VLAVTLDGRSLIAWLTLMGVIVFVVVVIARLVRREQNVRLTRIGVFVERERYEPKPGDDKERDDTQRDG